MGNSIMNNYWVQRSLLRSREEIAKNKITKSGIQVNDSSKNKKNKNKIKKILSEVYGKDTNWQRTKEQLKIKQIQVKLAADSDEDGYIALGIFAAGKRDSSQNVVKALKRRKQNKKIKLRNTLFGSSFGIVVGSILTSTGPGAVIGVPLILGSIAGLTKVGFNYYSHKNGKNQSSQLFTDKDGLLRDLDQQVEGLRKQPGSVSASDTSSVQGSISSDPFSSIDMGSLLSKTDIAETSKKSDLSSKEGAPENILFDITPAEQMEEFSSVDSNSAINLPAVVADKKSVEPNTESDK